LIGVEEQGRWAPGAVFIRWPIASYAWSTARIASSIVFVRILKICAALLLARFASAHSKSPFWAKYCAIIPVFHIKFCGIAFNLTGFVEG